MAKKFNAYVMHTLYYYGSEIIEADSLEEAEKIASERAHSVDCRDLCPDYDSEVVEVTPVDEE